MKRIGSIFLKSLLVIALMAGSTILLPQAGVSTAHQAHAYVRPGAVIFYLENLGYQVLDIEQAPNSECYITHTIKNGQTFLTYVFVKGESIIDHEDSSI
jgi:hypothetical protein